MKLKLPTSSPPPTALPSPTLPPEAIVAPPSQEDIARRAYQLWEAEGRPAGRDQAHWFEARRVAHEPRRTA